MAEVNEFEALDNPEEIRAEAEVDDGAGVGADGEKLADAQAVSQKLAGLTAFCCWSPLANLCPQRFPPICGRHGFASLCRPHSAAGCCEKAVTL